MKKSYERQATFHYIFVGRFGIFKFGKVKPRRPQRIKTLHTSVWRKRETDNIYIYNKQDAQSFCD